MKRIAFTLNQDYKSFEKNFKYQFEGDLILLSGINGAGKSQILNIIFGQEGKNQQQIISSTVSINELSLQKEEIEFRSFKENIGIQKITESTSQSFLNSVNNAWNIYSSNRLNPQHKNNIKFRDSCIEAKMILTKNFSEQDFTQGKINEDNFKKVLREASFVWKQGDMFTNAIGEIFSHWCGNSSWSL